MTRERPADTGLARLARGARRDGRGAAAVEFALVSLMFIQLVVSVFDFMAVISGWSAMQAACERAARYAMAHPAVAADTAKIKAYAVARAAEGGYPASKGMNFTVTNNTVGGTVYQTVRGTWDYRMHLAAFPVASIPLSAEAEAPIIP